MPREGPSDQVLITCLLAGVWKFPGETACEQEPPGSDSGSSFSFPRGGSEHSLSCSLSPRHLCTAPVPKLPVPPSPRKAAALHVPELVRKSTCTGTAPGLPVPFPSGFQQPAEGPEAPGQLTVPLRWPGGLSTAVSTQQQGWVVTSPCVFEELRQDFLPPLFLSLPFLPLQSLTPSALSS